jgi:hypothetical protein
MAKKERNRGSVDRARAKRGSGQAKVLLRRLPEEKPEMRFRALPLMDVPAENGPPVSLLRLARRHAPQEEAILRRPPRAINLYRALLDWQSEQTCAKPWTLLMPRSAPPSVKPPTVRWA